MSADRVTAVVLNSCNEPDMAGCIDSLKRQDYPALSILPADNANAGMKQALESGADYVLLINDAAVLEKGCVRELIYVAHAHPDAGAISPKILRFDTPDRIWFGGGSFDRMRASGRHEREHFVDLDPAERQVLEATFLPTCCLFIPAETLRTVGYFRDDFSSQVEDAEYGLRIMAAGRRLLYAPAARVRHRARPRGAMPSAGRIRLRDRNRRRLVRLHYERPDAARFAAWFYPTRILLMAGYGIRGELDRARAIWRGMVET